jgi:hypothetical protein
MIADIQVDYLPDRVLDFTEGKRGLLCGGNREVLNLRETLQKVFELKNLDWVYDDPGKSGAYLRARHRLQQGQYDFVIMCTRWCGHHVEDVMLPAAKEKKLPYIRVSSSFNPSAISRAIDDQVAKRLAQAH